MPAAAIQVLEPRPWYAAGLRREQADSNQQILFRSTASDCLKTIRDAPRVFTILDFDLLPQESSKFLQQSLTFLEQHPCLVIINRDQKSLIWEFMHLGCTGYLEKPVTINILKRFCQRVLAEPTASVFKTVN